MNITWLGHSCFMLEADGFRALLDPYNEVPGLPAIEAEANAVYCSHDHFDHAYTEKVRLTSGKENPFSVTEIQTFHDDKGGTLRGNNVIRKFTAGGVSVAHFGDLGHPLSPAQLEALGPCDAVLIPVGGFYTIDAPTAKAVAEAAVSLLAGVPSVVYGLVGMLVLVPGIRALFHVPDGASLLAAIIVLAIMILPSIIKVSITALEAVPQEYEDASLALGATPVETYFRVSVPAARSGIAAAVVLGVGRAIGEAMAVMMVSGNAANMPSLFESVRFLTTAVSSEMSYSSGLQRQALFSIALVLFLFIMLINAVLNFFLKRGKEG